MLFHPSKVPSMEADFLLNPLSGCYELSTYRWFKIVVFTIFNFLHFSINLIAIILSNCLHYPSFPSPPSIHGKSIDFPSTFGPIVTHTDLSKMCNKFPYTVLIISLLTRPSVWYEIEVLGTSITHVKSHATALGFWLQTDMIQTFQMRYCAFF